VPGAGLHLAMRSGRGRPTAFLMMSVMNRVRIMLMNQPRIVTWALCVPGRRRRAQSTRVPRGRALA
jgi:hypothetical protein